VLASAASAASASAAIRPIVAVFVKLLYRSGVSCDESAHFKGVARMF
jgi:hypothetical protein